MQNRKKLRADFIQRFRPNASIQPLMQDASNRHYYRITNGNQKEILVDAPDMLASQNKFITLSNYLNSIGLSAPIIYLHDEKKNFSLIEDFGVLTFDNLLANGYDQGELYLLASDVLSYMHQQSLPTDLDIPVFDNLHLLDAVEMMAEWYLPQINGSPLNKTQRSDLRVAWQQGLSCTENMQLTLVLRDYHCGNLMLLEQRDGVARCGLLDFQDAGLGSKTYDLISLLEDARRDINADLRSNIINGYMQKNQIDNSQHFWQEYHTLAAQRHGRILGIFCRLSFRDGKHQYLHYLPRVLMQFQRALDNANFSVLTSLLNKEYPKWRNGLLNSKNLDLR